MRRFDLLEILFADSDGLLRLTSISSAQLLWYHAMLPLALVFMVSCQVAISTSFYGIFLIREMAIFESP